MKTHKYVVFSIASERFGDIWIENDRDELCTVMVPDKVLKPLDKKWFLCLIADMYIQKQGKRVPLLKTTDLRKAFVEDYEDGFEIIVGVREHHKALYALYRRD